MRSASVRARHLAAALAAYACLAAGAPCATADASGRDMRPAYDAAIRCYIANGYVRNGFKKSGDAANARLFDVKAKQSFDLAYSWGGMLHLSQQEVTREIDRASESELRRLLTEGSYLTTVAKECKRRGLM